MFVTTREPGVRRRNRVYTNNKPARSSKISILSVFTVATTGSGGSNSTITQESYNRSQQKPKRRRPKEHRSRRSYEDKDTTVDVFDFLVGEETKSKETLAISDNAPDSESRASDGGTPILEPEPIAHMDESDPEGFYRSLSDSGISMGSSSSASGFSRRHHLPALPEEPPGRPSPQPYLGNELALADPRWMWPTSSPRPYTEGYIPPPCPPPPPAVIYDVPVYPYPPYTPYGTPPPAPAEGVHRPPITIREPTNRHVKPQCFRSFSKLSTRLILQMQDDIANLEEELKLLDEEDDAAEERSESGSPPSRRGTQDRKVREEEVYRELHVKLDNYYHALEMIQKVDRISQPAVTADLTTHHRWLESRVLERDRTRALVGSDLRKFTTGGLPEEVRPPQMFQPQYLAYSALVNAVVPLLMYKLISGILNRLVLLFLAVVAGSIVQEKMRTKIGKDELTCTLVCVSISAFAAVFL
ncbi:hypothetical protein LTR24_009489 [Lithohypha guttulata]|uniref:DUF6594 domain-containing protein n=1 Tax=Lithohypha guttulata TaxID=1690604 RepID=A0ABR0JYS3_9EURO|nr:hypothetical protein LTR24_009489 [Lithohypha guttulata]